MLELTDLCLFNEAQERARACPWREWVNWWVQQEFDDRKRVCVLLYRMLGISGEGALTLFWRAHPNFAAQVYALLREVSPTQEVAEC